MIKRYGKLFEAGEYKDKNFNISTKELHRAARLFKPVNNNLEHTKTLLDGKLGQLISVEVKGNEP